MPDAASLPEGHHDRDWFAWTQDQARRLRDLRPNGLDVDNLAEEIADLGTSQRRAVESLMHQIAQHLLQLEFLPWPGQRRHWRTEIGTFRDALEKEFRESPSLFARRDALYAAEWRRIIRDFARTWRERQTAPPPAALDPAAPHYDLDTQLLHEDWFPDPGSG